MVACSEAVVAGSVMYEPAGQVKQVVVMVVPSTPTSLRQTTMQAERRWSDGAGCGNSGSE